MLKKLIFIDDSGDPGFRDVSSNHFVMAAAIFTDSQTAKQLSQEISNYRRMLNWRDDYEIKFSKLRKDFIKDILRLTIKYDYQIYAAAINKSSFFQLPSSDHAQLYNWLIKELLLLIPVDNAKIKLDGHMSKQAMLQTISYIRRAINRNNTKKLDIKFEKSHTDNLMQLADLIAGSVNRSLSDKSDAMTYIDIVKTKIQEFKQITSR